MYLPIFERELRIGLKRRKAREQWVRAAGLGGAISLLFLVVMTLGSSASAGRALFRLLFVFACFGIVTRAFALTADLLSEERHNGTLGLLVLTGLTPLEIFANKLFGATLLASYGLLASLPYFTIPFLAGGVSAQQFFCALIFFANALLFCIATGLLASVIHREGGQAQITALAIAGTLCLTAPIARWMGSTVLGSFAVNPDWLLSSPMYAGYLVFTGFSGASPRQFWETTAITFACSLSALLLAAIILGQTWRDAPNGESESWLRQRFYAWLNSAPDSRRHLRARLLARNPFSWMAARDRSPPFAAQVFLAVVALGYFGVFYIAGLNWPTLGNALFTSAILHIGLNWIVAYAAGKRFGDDRQRGGFEVLLTTPLSPKEIIEGQSEGLLVQFRKTWCMVVAFDLLVASSNFLRGSWDTSKVLIYSIMWTLLIMLWYSVHLETAARAMWISLWTGRPGYAAIQAMRAKIWGLFWLWFLTQVPFRRNVPFHSGEMAALLLFVVAIMFATFGRRGSLRDKLVREFTDIVSAPIPPRGNKIFKKWDPQKIYPPSRWGIRVRAYLEAHQAQSRAAQTRQ